MTLGSVFYFFFVRLTTCRNARMEILINLHAIARKADDFSAIITHFSPPHHQHCFDSLSAFAADIEVREDDLLSFVCI